MNSLASYILAAMTSWTPLAEHRYYEPESVTAARYESIADDIAAVVEEATDRELPLRDAEYRRERTALILASIARFESAYAADVDACRRGGDRDPKGVPRSWTIMQLQDVSRAVVCSSRRIALRHALWMVTRSWEHMRAEPIVNRLAWYTDGGRCKTDRARTRSAHRMGLALAYWRAHPYAAPSQ